MQLEQTLGMYQPIQTQGTQERERTYTTVNLESMSASALYSGDSKEYNKYVRETIREDDHAPFGEHLNYEVWLDLKGKKEGRSKQLTNVHIPLQKGS